MFIYLAIYLFIYLLIYLFIYLFLFCLFAVFMGRYRFWLSCVLLDFFCGTFRDVIGMF